MLLVYSVQPLVNTKFDMIERTYSEARKAKNYHWRPDEILKKILVDLESQPSELSHVHSPIM